MPTSQLRLKSLAQLAVAALAALALVLSGCGGDEPESGIQTVNIELRDGGFARGTSLEQNVPADALLVLRVTADDNGPYRLSVLSSKTAQTFKFAEAAEKTISLDNLGPGGEAKLILGNGRETIKLVADR